MSFLRRWSGRALILAAALPTAACDLCAIYSADNAREQRDSGFFVTLSEAFISYHTVQLNGEEIDGPNMDFRDSSITHIVPGYNITRRLGVSLNIPLVVNHFKRTEVRYSLTEPAFIRTEHDTEFGLGDLSLVGRFTLFEKHKMKYSVALTALAGVKFPTGDTDRIADEVEQTRIYDALSPPGVPHDPLGHSISGVHQHDLSPGSGSYDGIFGLTMSSRWQRWFCNAQFQYYLRTEGESDYERGDEFMASGGPGFYLWSGQSATLNLQANAGYDTMNRDVIAGRTSNNTGMTAWYMGPQLGGTIGDNFSAVIGVDIPLRITSNGLQNVPDYRIHASFVWKF
jgi:hypothetical protein